MRALPVTIQPVAAESWTSYLRRTAAFYCCNPEDLGEHLGLRGTGRWPPHHGLTLDASLTSHAARALGLTTAQINAMHLARWDGTALDLGAITGHGPRPWPLVPLSWTYLAHPRTCIACSRDGYELLYSYLPWITCCPHHDQPLTDSSGPPPGDPRTVRRNRQLVALLDEPTGKFAGQRVTAAVALRSWLECAVLIAAAEGRQDWRSPPTATAAGQWLTHAADIADAPTIHDAEQLLRPVIRRPTIRASRYAQASLYGPPIRNLIDSLKARWNRSSATVA